MKNTISMHDFFTFRLAKVEEESARNNLNYAGMLLETRSIRKRLAKLKSQTDAKPRILTTDPEVLELMYKAAYWVVIGRLPEE